MRRDRESRGLLAFVLPVLLVTLIIPASAGAGQWVRLFEGRHVASVLEVSEGGYLAVGAADDRLWLLRFDEAGNVAWERHYLVDGGGSSILELPGGGYLVAGSTMVQGRGIDALVMRLDPRGNVIWSRSFGGRGYDGATRAVLSADGNCLVAASIYSSNGTFCYYRICLMKLNLDGEIIWQRRYGSIGSGGPAYHMEATPDNGCILTGSSIYTTTETGWIMKLDAGGTPQWQRRYGLDGSRESRLECIRPLSSGGYIAAGFKRPDDPSNFHLWVLRLDDGGGVMWQRIYPIGFASSATDIIPTTDGGFLLAGEAFTDLVDGIGLLLKLDGEGNPLWSRFYLGGGDYETFLTSVRETTRGGYIATGYGGKVELEEPFGLVARVDQQGLVEGCTLIEDVTVSPITTAAPAEDTAELGVVSSYGLQARDIHLGSQTTPVLPLCADPGRLTVLCPDGGETVPTGRKRTITWSAPPEMVEFRLGYSLNRGRTWRRLPGPVVERRFPWPTPRLLRNVMRRCLVRVSGFNAAGEKVGTDRSDGVFSLEVVRLTQPGTFTLIPAGFPYTVAWRTWGTARQVARVELHLASWDGATWEWEKIASLEGNPGSYRWTAPAEHGAYRMRVVLLDGNGESLGSDATDDFFAVYQEP